MGKNLSQAAFEVLKSAPPIGRRREQAADGSISTVERLTLVLLADWARDETGLAWPSQPTIAEHVGCSANTVGPALDSLTKFGHISIMPKRHGRFALYLVHPGGIGDAPPLSLDAVRAHLSRGRRFSASDQNEVLSWLAGLARLGGPAGSAVLIQAASRRLSSKPKTPPTIGGVSDVRNSPDTPNHCEQAPQPLRASPPMVGGESTIEPEIETIARDVLHEMNQRVCSTDLRQTTIQTSGAGTAYSKRATKAANKADKFDWRGEPGAVLERALAGGGERAARLKAMDAEEALEKVRVAQRQAGVAPVRSVASHMAGQALDHDVCDWFPNVGVNPPKTEGKIA